MTHFSRHFQTFLITKIKIYGIMVIYKQWEQILKKKIALLTCGWNNSFNLNFISGMKKALASAEADIYIFNAYNYTEYSGFLNFTGFSIFNLINYEDYDGVIILSDLIDNPRILERERQRILKAGVPAIAINKKINGLNFIKIDNYTGFYRLLTHLIMEHRLTKFAYVSGSEKSLEYAERYKAFRTITTEKSIFVPNERIVTIEKSCFKDAYAFFSGFLDTNSELPEVIVCANDQIALACLLAAKENEIKVPENLKIVGYEDEPFSKIVHPAITTVQNSTTHAGYGAVNRFINGNTDLFDIKFEGNMVLRESCGCSSEKTTKEDGTLSILSAINQMESSEEFSNHLNSIGELFTEAMDVFSLLTNIENYFVKSHKFEGNDFCIFLKSDWSSVLINSEENLPQNITYGTQVQPLCSIQNDKKSFREMISTKSLIPEKMKSEGNNIYLFMPIFYHSYVHGYFVTKNNLFMLENANGYKWTRNFGDGIEQFRKKNMFKQMSQQYLKLSTRDALSGLLNRAGIEKLAKPFFQKNKNERITTILYFVDINRMKVINDQFGHLHGDLAVKTIAAAVLETVPKNWLCIRYGGDEFLVVGNTVNYNGEDYCAKIKERISQKTSVMRLPYSLTASVGSYLVDPDSKLSLEEAVNHVDNLMYIQKQAFHKTH